MRGFYQLFVVNLLSDEFVFTQRIAGLSGDGIDWPLLHLLLYGTVEHEKGLTCALLTETDRQTDFNPSFFYFISF